ncbi:MAG: sulfurtransferase TusA family protein [Planctomycetes bacterium]|nr:sulfurtransferase TusA family protein [Planctomycetota bacterium]
MAESSAELTERSLQWIQRRDCFYEAWLRAGDDEGLGRVDRPSCLFTASSTAAPTVEHAAVATDSPPPHDAELDAGDLGCGDLVIELKFRLADLAPGTVLRLTARDPAAPVDLPAWCGLVGHTLLHSSHPLYWIRRKQP